MKSDEKIKCFTCDKDFSYSNHKYHGKIISIYDITVCDSCYKGNHNGWVSQYEEKIIKHMKNPIPKRNDKGLLPRELDDRKT